MFQHKIEYTVSQYKMFLCRTKDVLIKNWNINWCVFCRISCYPVTLRYSTARPWGISWFKEMFYKMHRKVIKKIDKYLALKFSKQRSRHEIQRIGYGPCGSPSGWLGRFQLQTEMIESIADLSNVNSPGLELTLGYRLQWTLGRSSVIWICQLTGIISLMLVGGHSKHIQNKYRTHKVITFHTYLSLWPKIYISSNKNTRIVMSWRWSEMKSKTSLVLVLDRYP